MTAINSRKQVKLQIIDKDHACRSDVESYIKSRYEQAFNAHIDEFMPMFVAIYDQHQQLLSTCGYRVASDAPLFLEQYLDAPAEQLMGEEFGQTIERQKLIEFGQLASFSRGMSPMHFMLMAEHLVALGYEWCIFTATDPLYAMMCRLGLEPTILAHANSGQISDTQDKWGTYYHHRPKVSAGNLKEGLQKLLQRPLDRSNNSKWVAQA